MIQISGLTQHEHEILDRLWTTDSLEDAEEWMSSLSESDQLLAQSLAQLLILEHLDTILDEQFSDCADAKNILARF